MTAYDRRQFLRLGTLGAALGGASSLSPVRAWALPVDGGDWVGGVVPQKKLLFVFLRGGNDGANMLFPSGDPQYYNLRSTIAIPPMTGIDIGSNNCELHPAMSALQPLIDAKDVAFIHRVGYANSSRSHFTAMQMYETAYSPPAGLPLEEFGFLGRYMQEIACPGNALPAAGFESLARRSLLADGIAYPHIPALADYALDDLLIGEEALGAEAGLLGAYIHAPDSEVRDAGLSLLRSLRAVGSYDPAAQSSAYPAGEHGDHCREAMYVLGATDCNVATISIGSYDTHANQGGAVGAQATLLTTLAECLLGAYQDATGTVPNPPFAPFWDDLLICVVSEFGRTAAENASNGTDHGDGGAALVAGGKVGGRQYNCQGNKYYINGQSPLGYGGINALKFRTDYRALYSEILREHLGMNAVQLNTIIPNYSALKTLPEFKEVNFLMQSLPI